MLGAVLGVESFAKSHPSGKGSVIVAKILNAVVDVCKVN